MMREKWDRAQSGSTYGAKTIAKAIAGCSKVYEPPVQYGISIGRKPKPEKTKLYTYDDMGNAERLKDAFAERIRYSYVDKCWYYYDERVWRRDRTGVIERLADEIVTEMQQDKDNYLRQPVKDQDDEEKAFMKHLKYSRSNKGKKAMLAETMHHVPIEPHQMDAHNHMLNTPNGVLHLRTGVLRGAQP